MKFGEQGAQVIISTLKLLGITKLVFLELYQKWLSNFGSWRPI